MMVTNKWYENQLLRKILFPIMRSFNFRVKITHPQTKRKFYLKFWDHKGYWFHGVKREAFENQIFEKLIQPGDTVLEVGAHIGFVTQFFEYLVGDDGDVIACEPTKDTLEFLRTNTLNSTILVAKAVSNSIGIETLYREKFGGFTNSLDHEFTKEQVKNLSETQRNKAKTIEKAKVQTTTIDRISAELNIQPDFIKIDVEGVELKVLQGAKVSLQRTSFVMIEISKNIEEIYQLMDQHGFKRIYPKDGPTTSVRHGNVFFAKQNTEKNQLKTQELEEIGNE